MTQVTLAQIVNAVEETLGAAAVLKRSQSFNELTESIAECPLLQVFPDEFSEDSATRTDRTTFKGGVRQKDIVVLADFYAHRRANINEDYAIMVQGWDELIVILEAQDTKPYFGLSGIKSFRWLSKRTTFQYDDPAARYAGVRFTITLTVF